MTHDPLESVPVHHFDKEWFHLPVALRRKWWIQTDYGRLKPTDRLMTDIKNALEDYRIKKEAC